MPDPLVYDVGLDEDYDLPVRTQHITGFALILQRVRRRLKTHLGEYLADASVGLPFMAWIAQKPPNVEGIGAVMRRTIETTPGVARVTAWSGTFDRETRTLSYTGSITTIDGDSTITILPLGSPSTGNRNASVRLLIGSLRIIPS